MNDMDAERPPVPVWLSVNEAAKCLGVAPALVVWMAKADILLALLFGRRRKFSTEAIKRFFKEREAKA